MAQSVLVTGSSSGIGKEVAMMFQRNGWNVAASMRQPSRAVDLDRLDHMIIPQMDVTNEATIQKAIKQTLKEFGQIDVLVNNAGYGLFGPAEAATEEQIARQMETNFLGTVRVIRAVLPHFRERGTGTIVNVTSVAGRLSSPMQSYYNASKWAVEGFSEALYHELRPLGIRVKLVEPGPVRTNFLGRSLDMAKIEKDLSVYQSLSERVLGKLREMTETSGASPLQVAQVVYRAATSRSWRLRYAGDKNARLILWGRRLLPDVIFLGILRSVFSK